MLDELDEKLYFNHLTKNHSRVDMILHQFQSIKSVIKEISDNIKIFPTIKFFENTEYISGIYHKTFTILTNYNFYIEVRWLVQVSQYYSRTHNDYILNIHFYDTKSEYSIRCTPQNINIFIPISEDVQKINEIKKLCVKDIHPKLLFTYMSIMDFDICKSYYSKINNDYNLVEHIKQENEKQKVIINHNYNKQISDLENEKTKLIKENEYYIEEITSNAILVEKQRLEITKLQNMNNLLIKKKEKCPE